MYRILKEQIFVPLYEKYKNQNTHNFLEQLKKSQFFSADLLEELRWKKVLDIIKHSYDNCDYYRDVFKDIGIEPQDIKDPSIFRKLPILTKDKLQKNLHRMVAKNIDKNDIHRDATGGSTGNHTPFFRDNKCLEIKKAAELRFDSWTGWKLGQNKAFYWPAIQDFGISNPSLKRKLKTWFFEHEHMLYAGVVNKDTFSEHYQKIAGLKPNLMRAFPNPLTLFAKHINEEEKEKLTIPSIITVGEPLLDSHRKKIETAFNSEVFNCYVSRECGNIACECNKHQYLHINSELLYVEIVNQNADGVGKVVITDLHNYGMPFIRYQIEDMGKLIDKKCECGINLPLMDIGACRTSDFILSPYNQSIISGSSFLHYMIAEGPEVGQIQVVQDQKDHLKIKIIKGHKFADDKLKHFDKVINSIFHGKMKYDFLFVENIEREKSGKYRFVISNIEK